MTSYKEVHNELLISHYEGVLNNYELLLLYNLNQSNILNLPHDCFPNFNFDALEDNKCLSEFHFHKCNLPLPAELHNGVN